MDNYETYQDITSRQHDDQVVTLGEWAAWLAIVTLVPIYGIIHVFITAFGQNKKDSMRNFARVYLIYLGITFFISFALIMPIIYTVTEVIQSAL